MMDMKINKQINLTEKFQKGVETNKNELTGIEEQMNHGHTFASYEHAKCSRRKCGLNGPKSKR